MSVINPLTLTAASAWTPLDTIASVIWLLLALYVVAKFARSIRIVPTRYSYIVERLGRCSEALGPGFHVLIPFIDRVAFIQDLRELAIEVPPQECFTKDNVKILVDGVIYLSVADPKQASYGVTDYKYATIQLAQTTTRSVIGTLDLDETFEERERISSGIVGELAMVSEAWGIRVHRYELKNIVPPETVREAMERQMAAERERRALLARVEGEKQSKINTSEGAKQEAINRSEGEKQRRTNEAEGIAAEIRALAQATAKSIETVGAAIAQPGGEAAIRLQLSETFFEKIGHLAQPKTQVVLPADLTRFDDILDRFGLTIDHDSLRSLVPLPTPSYPHADSAAASAPRVVDAAEDLGLELPAQGNGE